MKYLVVFVVVVGLLWWLLLRPRRGATRDPGKSGHKTEPLVTFVACAHCGVHLPTVDAVMDGAKTYCSQAHRIAGPRDPDRS